MVRETSARSESGRYSPPPGCTITDQAGGAAAGSDDDFLSSMELCARDGDDFNIFRATIIVKAPRPTSDGSQRRFVAFIVCKLVVVDYGEKETK
jgi:hypothetical protein